MAAKNSVKTNEQLTKTVNALIRLTDGLSIELSEIREAFEELKETAEAAPAKKSGGRDWTEDQRKAAGQRLQMGRAKNLGLDSIEQLRALKLRPGQKPTKAEIKAVKKEFPVDEVNEVDVDDAPDDGPSHSAAELKQWTIADLRELAETNEVDVPAKAKKAELVRLLAE